MAAVTFAVAANARVRSIRSRWLRGVCLSEYLQLGLLHLFPHPGVHLVALGEVRQALHPRSHGSGRLHGHSSARLLSLPIRVLSRCFTTDVPVEQVSRSSQMSS